MQADQVKKIACHLAKDEDFLIQLAGMVKSMQRSCCQDTTYDSSQGQFVFERSSKNYFWPGGEQAECEAMITSITNTLEGLIDLTLHDVLRKEFVNIGHELHSMREQIITFTKQQMDKTDEMKQEFSKQLATLKRKLTVQQLGMTDQIKQEFGRELEALKSKLSGQSSEQSQLSRRSSLLSHVTSSIGDKSMDKSVHHELHQLKADMEKLKKTDTAEMGKMINEKVVYLDDKYNKEIMDLKIKTEFLKQRLQASQNELIKRMQGSSVKKEVAAEVQRATKSSLKVSFDQISKMQMKCSKIEESVCLLDRNLQDYVSNQLKSVWVQVSNLKRRTEDIEEKNNMMNQSFIME